MTVTVEGKIPTGGSIAVNTTPYNGKNTFDRNGMPTTLTSGQQFWVDSGNGQQNTPVLNVTVPEGYRAQVKRGDGNYADAGLNYSLGEITATTNVSVKFVEGELPVSSIAVTDTTGPYTLSTYTVERKTDGTEGNTIAPKKYDGYTVVGYKLNGGKQATIGADGTVTIELNNRSQTIEFIYKRADNSVVVPGPDGKLAPPDDKDNVTIQPTDSTKKPTVDGEGKVTVPEGGGSVIGGGLILYALAFGFEPLDKVLNLKVFRIVVLCALCFYSFAKCYSFFCGANHLETIFKTGIPGRIFSAGLIMPLNVAVGIVVACTMYGFYSIFQRGKI